MTRRRGEVNHAGVFTFAQTWHGKPRAKKLSRDIDSERAIPIRKIEVLDLASRPCDPGVINQDVKSAELCINLCE